MVTPERLQQLLPAYAEEAKLFFYSYGLADLVIDLHIDHVAIKGLNKEVYNAYVKMYLPLSKRLSFESVGERDIAVAELIEPLDAGTFGTVSLLVIMEPKPDAIATTHDLIDYIALLTPGLDPIKTALKNKEVQFKEQIVGNLSSLVIEINEWGQEVKFTDHSLQNIAETQIKNGEAKVLTAND